MTDTTTRKRKRPSLISALAQVQKAGFEPTSATVTADSVVIGIGRRDEVEGKTNNNSEEKNEWDNI
jgi:hypothetical protein